MPKRTKNYKSIDESNWKPSDRLREYVHENYPDVDFDKTIELFTDNCLAHDRVYANWDAAFRNWLRSPADWGGIAYKDGMDPSWRPLIQEADALGFRRPRLPIESKASYRQALREFNPPQQNQLLDSMVAGAIKRMPK